MSKGQYPYPPPPPPSGPAQPQSSAQFPTPQQNPPQSLPQGQYQQNPPQSLPQGQGGLPQYHLPDETAIQEAYSQARQEAARIGGGDGPQFIKFAGPQGQFKWDSSVWVGYESTVTVYILPPWAAGRSIFKKVLSHFWKSGTSPQGTSIGCPGPETCLICQSKEIGLAHPDANVRQRAKDFGRVRKQYLYNVVALDNYEGHFTSQGLMRPFLLGAGTLLHKAIGDIIDGRRGAINIVDPMRGRPIRLKRRKTGPMPMDIEYSALDMDPMPLPQQFYPCLQNLWDLDKMSKIPTHEDMVKAVMDMGIPLVGQTPMQSQQFEGFQAAPAPAYPNPYQQPQLQQQVFQVPQQYPQFAQKPAYQPSNDAVSQQIPPTSWETAIPQQSTSPVPPPLSPPPIQSNGADGSYSPRPSQMGAAVGPPSVDVPTAASTVPGSPVPPAPPVTAPPSPGAQPIREPVRAPVSQSVGKLPHSLPPGINLPGGRERCFGKMNPQDQYCQQCPPDIHEQCAAVSGVASDNAEQAKNLAQLQAQLGGKSQ